MVRFGNDIDGVELEPGQSIKDQNGNEVLRVTEDGTVVNSSEGLFDTAGFGGRPFSTASDKVTGDGTASNKYNLVQSYLDDLGAGYGFLDSGRYETDGLVWPQVDWMDETTDSHRALYLRGTGVRETTLEESADVTDSLLRIVDQQDTGGLGNFGGLSRMTIWGHNREGAATTGALVHQPMPDTGESRLIDLLYSELIIRHGGHDGLRIDEGGSGTRFMNSWVEQNDRDNLHLSKNFTRGKFDNLHITQAGRRNIHTNTAGSQYSNLTLWVAGEYGLYDTGVKNQYSNVNIEDADRGIHDRNEGGQHANVTVERTTEDGVQVRGNNIHYSNLSITDADRHGFVVWDVPDERRALVSNLNVDNFGLNTTDTPYGVWLRKNNAQLTNVSISQADVANGDFGMRIDGNNNVVSNVTFRTNGLSLYFSGTENIVSDVTGHDSLDDFGTRNIINGRGTNDGDPSVGGQWNGNAAFAETHDATIHDETNGNLYKAIGGTWTQIG